MAKCSTTDRAQLGVVDTGHGETMIRANETIDSIMTKPTFGVAPDDPLAEADAIMRGNGIHHLVVREDGRLVGVLSALDLLRVPPGDRPNRPVSSVMTRDIEAVAPNATIREVLDRFASASFSAMPVVTEDGELVGIVTVTDLEQLLYADF